MKVIKGSDSIAYFLGIWLETYIYKCVLVIKHNFIACTKVVCYGRQKCREMISKPL